MIAHCVLSISFAQSIIYVTVTCVSVEGTFCVYSAKRFEVAFTVRPSATGASVVGATVVSTTGTVVSTTGTVVSTTGTVVSTGSVVTSVASVTVIVNLAPVFVA